MGQVAARPTTPRHGVGTPHTGRRTVVEYSGINVAREMHIGHLRTTILGDCLARVVTLQSDLSTSRTKDYLFEVDRMTSSTGNTGVYLHYAHARIHSLLAKAGQPAGPIDPTQPLHPAERVLAVALDGFGATVTEVGDLLEPHRLCGYLYDLAKAFSTFYQQCPVVTEEEPLRGNRITLCQLTAVTLHKGLDLLGIAAPNRT